MSDDRNQAIRLLEATLFASPEPLDERDLAEHLPGKSDVRALLEDLAQLYANRGVNLVRVGSAWTFRTAPDLSDALKVEKRVPRRLSRAAVETLAVIAYHQPITRAEIEEVRGVSLNKGMLDVLIQASWVKPGRRRRTPGRPLTWVTTPGFLDHFGLERIGDLPGIDDLKASGFLDSRPAIQGFRAVSGSPPDDEDDQEDQPAPDLDAEDESDLSRPEPLGD